MRKATQKTTPVSLGTKRACPDCGTKFYDFNKEQLTCPKCDAKIDVADLNNPARVAEAKKTVKAAKEIPEEALIESEDLVVAGGDEAFESVDELDDENEDIADDIEVEEEGEDY